MVQHSRTQLPSGALALVGPGRAGTTVAIALAARGWTPVAVAGRSVDAPSTVTAAERLGARVVEVADAGREADLVVVATPDAAIADTALAFAAGLRTGALVVHLSGACPVEELDKLQGERPDVQVGALHPLQSLPSVELGLARLPGSWCAVDGPPAVERLALSLGMRPFRVAPGERARAPRGRDHRVQPSRRVARAGGARCRSGGAAARGTAPVGTGERRQRRSARRGRCAHRSGRSRRCRHRGASPPDAARRRAGHVPRLALEALRLSGRDDPALRTVIDEHGLDRDDMDGSDPR